MKDAERLLTQVRELVRLHIYPGRQRLAILGVANLFIDERLSESQRMECLILMERLLAQNTRLIQMLGIAEYVGQIRASGCSKAESIRKAAACTGESLSRIK